MALTKPVKILTYSVIGVITLAVIAAIALVTLVDPNNYKQTLNERISVATNRPFAINGDINWGFYPWLKLKVADVEMGNNDEFQDKPFAAIKELSANVKLLPLLSGKVSIGSIDLQQPTIHLWQRGNSNNWEDLIAGDNSAKEEKPAADKPSAKTEGKQFSLEIASLNINNASLILHNLDSNEQKQLTNFNLTTGGVTSSAPFKINANFTMADSAAKYENNVKITATAVYKDEDNSITSNDFVLVSDIKSPEFPAESFELKAKLQYSGDKQNFMLQDLTVKTGGINANGNLIVDDIGSSMKYKADLVITSYDANAFAKTINALAGFNLDTAAVRNAELNLKIVGDENKLTANPLSIKLAKTNLNGQASVSNFDAPNFDFNLEANEINLDDMLAKNSGSKAKASSSKATTAATTTASSKDSKSSITKAKGNGNITIGKTIFNGLTINNFNMKLAMSNGIIRANSINADLYNGKLSGNAVVNVSHNPTNIEVNQQLTNVALEPLLKALNDKNSAFAKGNLTASFSGKTAGIDANSFTQNLQGDAKINLSSGEISNIDVPFYLDQANALINKNITPRSNTGRTTIQSLSATANIKNGIAYNYDLVAAAEDYNVTGEGKVDLLQKQMTYRIQARKTGADASNLPLAIRISGSFDKPIATPDFDAYAKALAEREIKKQTDKIQDKVEEKIEKAIGDKIKGIKLDGLFR